MKVQIAETRMGLNKQEVELSFPLPGKQAKWSLNNQPLSTGILQTIQTEAI